MNKDTNEFARFVQSSRKGRLPSTLPPLNHIRAFEATVRNGSVHEAAKELNISESSVSRHNRLLQEDLGISLFDETVPRKSVTPKGQMLADGIASAFRVLEDTTRSVAHFDTENALMITCPGVLLKRWLIPRLDPFLQKYRDIELHFSHLEPHPCAFSEECSMQLSISFSRLQTESKVLCPDPVVPVMKATLFDKVQSGAPQPPIRLLCTKEDEAAGGWQDWFGHVPELQAFSTIKYFLGDPDAAFEAGLRGQGIVLARTSVAQTYLENGDLVRLGEARDAAQDFLWYTTPESRSMTTLERRFLSWLRAETVF